MTKWISVKDKLPENGKNVLCCVVNGHNFINLVLYRDYFTHDGMASWFVNFVMKDHESGEHGLVPEIPDENVTHWRELPPLPKSLLTEDAPFAD